MAWEPAISFVQQQMGMDRVMYAMDYPYQYELGEVAAMDALPLTPEHKKMFYESNAVKLFRL
jgi:2,3-dihydroxybenzoate decarboxylase